MGPITWKLIVSFLWETFGPRIEAWLADLFAKLNLDALGDPALIDPPAGMERLFVAARKQLPWGAWLFHPGKRRALLICERIAKRRAKEFWHACFDGLGAPRLSHAEREEVEAV